MYRNLGGRNAVDDGDRERHVRDLSDNGQRSRDGDEGHDAPPLVRHRVQPLRVPCHQNEHQVLARFFSFGGLFALKQVSYEGPLVCRKTFTAKEIEERVTVFEENWAEYFGRVCDCNFAGMLLEKGADVNDGSLYLTTEMRNLAFYKNRPNPPEKDKKLSNLDVIRMLLERGADANQAYTKKIPPREAQGDIKVVAGATPLFRATKSMDLATIRLLMEKGANPSVAFQTVVFLKFLNRVFRPAPTLAVDDAGIIPRRF